jgi:phosphomannomutase
MLLSEYDIRGIFKKDLTLEIIYNVVQQFFYKLKIKKALLAVDFNKNNWLIKNFLERNFPFEFLGILPTPIFYYEVIKRKKPGIMITASHLPLKYSGLKFILENGEPWKPTLTRTNADFTRTNADYARLPAGKAGTSADSNLSLRKSAFNNYFNHLQKIIKPKKKIYVNFDKKNFFLNSSLPYFQKLKIFDADFADYTRTNADSNLSLRKSLSADKAGASSLRKSALIKIKSDFDNDRIFVFVKKPFNGPRQSALSLRKSASRLYKIHNDLIFYFLAKLPQYQKLGSPIFFSQKLKNELLKLGKKIYFIPTGHYFFKKAFKKYKLDLAFEPSGHFYMFKDLKTEGPYLALGLFLHSIDDLKDLLKLNSSLQLYRFDVNADSRGPNADLRGLEKLVSFLQKKFKLKLKKFDGYLLYNQDFYLHLRKSKTENKIRISYEGSKKYLKEIKKWLMKI